MAKCQWARVCQLQEAHDFLRRGLPDAGKAQAIAGSQPKRLCRTHTYSSLSTMPGESATVRDVKPADFIAASSALLCERGSFDEIGKRLIWAVERHGASRHDVRYSAIALAADLARDHVATPRIAARRDGTRRVETCCVAMRCVTTYCDAMRCSVM